MMSEKEKVFYGDIVKVGRVYWLGSSLVVVYHGPWYYVGDKVAEILKSMRMEWKANNYRQYCHEFERNSSRWVVYLDVIEPAGSAVEPKETILKIYMQRVEPSALRFSVLYHPKTVTLDSVNLEDLLKSLLYWLPHIAEDLSNFAGWIHLMNKNYIIAYHDKELVSRIDLVLSHLKLPYKFVLSYHIDRSFLSVDLHVASDIKYHFDVLAESILDEYYKELTGGEGDRR